MSTTSEDQAKSILESLKAAYVARLPRAEISRNMHTLAESGNNEATIFFKSLLDDSDWDWRLEGVQLLGFHYLLASNVEIMDKFRQLLLNDPEPIVRIASASALGSQLRRGQADTNVMESQWPDQALLVALRSDIDTQVRFAAFGALLESANVPFPIVRQVEQSLKDTKNFPTIDDVNTVLKKAKIKLVIPS